MTPITRANIFLTSLFLIAASFALIGCAGSKSLTEELTLKSPPIVVFQPSHQSDTGVEFNEGLVCNGIVDSGMTRPARGTTQYKVWSYNVEGLHHARTGSNTKISQTTEIDSGRISGYAYEIAESNKLHPDIFIAVHNNGGTNKNNCWGFVHEGDPNEKVNREIARIIVAEICKATDLTDAGVHGDSEPNRNDYRCVSTGKLSFYSLDEHNNTAPYRLLLEIGDNRPSRKLLQDPEGQKAIGLAIQRGLEKILDR